VSGVQAILLAAGKGTRMWPLATRTPKPLLRVAGRSLLFRMLDALAAAGASECVVVIGHGGPAVAAAAAAWRGAMAVRCVEQGEPRGTGHAVAAAAPYVKGDCLLAMADGLVAPATLQALAKAGGFAVAAQEVADPSRYGALSVSGDKVTGIAEKSKAASSRLVNTGFYRVPLAAVKACVALKPSPRGELEFTDVLAAWAKDGKVRWLPAQGWLDVGTPWDLLSAHEATLGPWMDFLLEGLSRGGTGTIEEGVHLRGRLYVEAGAVVKAGTYVEGDVYVGAGSRVGPNAYLRGPVALGRDCHVGAATELKNSVLLDGAHAPHLHYIGDSVLGEGCNLGAGTIVANLRHDGASVLVSHRGAKADTGRRKFGAIVGDGAKVGVNCSLNPGTLLAPEARVPAGTAVKGTVGAPPA
jgi:UDP-N-acetylglucosamine diphosphorylase / glucose-1-phosphate thymidylyltransferase / UDP-N-acetylgalactosamine diphosphorylase / glucosamine-1-phosphate N-acetyltransferase / galactosamine-1-phosphate N-acetyltransferase